MSLAEAVITNKPTHWPVGLEAYHADTTSDSNSSLSLFLENRWAYYEQRVLGIKRFEKEKDYLTLGTALHLGVENFDALDGHIHVLDEGFRRAGKVWLDIQDEHAGKLILTHADGKKLYGMIEGVRRNPRAVELLSGEGWSEHAVRWVDEQTGLVLKACFDWLKPIGIDVDIKTTGEDDFAAAMWNFGYYRQAAIYKWAAEKYLEREVEHYHVVCESTYPHECYVHKTGPRTLERGWEHFRQILDSLAACKLYDDPSVWHKPGHGTVIDTEMHDWAFNLELTL